MSELNSLFLIGSAEQRHPQPAYVVGIGDYAAQAARPLVGVALRLGQEFDNQTEYDVLKQRVCFDNSMVENYVNVQIAPLFKKAFHSVYCLCGYAEAKLSVIVAGQVGQLQTADYAFVIQIPRIYAAAEIVPYYVIQPVAIER